MKDGHRIYVPEEALADAPNGQVEHLKDHWWSVHPEHGLCFYTRTGRGDHVYPQANDEELVARKIGGELYPDLEIRMVPHVFLRLGHDGRLMLPKEYR